MNSLTAVVDVLRKRQVDSLEKASENPESTWSRGFYIGRAAGLESAIGFLECEFCTLLGKIERAAQEITEAEVAA